MSAVSARSPVAVLERAAVRSRVSDQPYTFTAPACAAPEDQRTAEPDFGAHAMYVLLAQRFGPKKMDIAEMFALHSGKDKRTILRYLSGELAIPRWAVFMTIVLCQESSEGLAALWNKARSAASTYQYPSDTPEEA